ncbi:MAG: insulinase family protein [Deltaproteobacteria bacterium]|nr:insulinase family protein [Deltaproteobacteria bacterium]
MKRFLSLLICLVSSCAVAPAPHRPAVAHLAPVAAPPVASVGWRLTPDSPFRATEPPAAESAYFVPPRIERHTLSNGVVVILVPRPGPQVATLAVASVGIPDDKSVSRAMSRFATDALGLGAGSRTQSEIVMTEASLLARRSHGDYSNLVYLQTQHLSESTDKLIEIDADLVQRPTFPDKSIEWLKTRIAPRVQEHQSQEATAFGVFRAVVYGPDHFLGRPTALRAEELRAITRNAVVKAYKATFVPGKVVLIATGGVDPAKLLPKLESAFGSWKTTRDKKMIVRPEPAQPATSARLIVVDQPGASQAEIVYGRVGPGWSSADYAPVDVAHRYVGVLSFGPLMRRLREELHLTFNGKMSIWATKEPGLLDWHGRVPRDAPARVLTEIDKALGELRSQDVPAQELALTRQRTRFWDDTDLETAADLSNMALKLAGLECDESEPARFQDRVDAVTAADIRRVAQTWFDSSRWQAVVVGDWNAMRESLVKLGWGPIEIRDDHGKLVRIEK